MPNHEMIDGTKLRLLLTRKGEKQVHLAERIGMDRYLLNRWCRPKQHRVRRDNLATLAEGIGLSLEDMLAECGVLSVARHLPASDLAPAERAILNRFRGLSPLEQAKVLVAFDETVSRVQSSHEKRSK